jgi:hypothetical protein
VGFVFPWLWLCGFAGVATVLAGISANITGRGANQGTYYVRVQVRMNLPARYRVFGGVCVSLAVVVWLCWRCNGAGRYQRQYHWAWGQPGDLLRPSAGKGGSLEVIVEVWVILCVVGCGCVALVGVATVLADPSAKITGRGANQGTYYVRV